MGLINRLAKAILPARAPTTDEISKTILDSASPGVRGMLDTLGIDLGQSIEKEARSVVPEAITSYGFLQETPYDPFTLERVAQRHWVVRTCHDKLVREATRKGYRWAPLYEAKCEECGAQFEYLPQSEVCPECQGELTTPDPEQLVAVNRFLEHPNPQYTMGDILKRNASDLIVFDDFYVSVGSKSTALEVWPEDVKWMRIIADLKGRLGGDCFCPIEEDNKTPGSATKFYSIKEYPPSSPCPNDDGGVLERIAYAQSYGYQVVAAFKKEDILHDNLNAKGSRLYGIPKLWAVQTQVIAMMMIDNYQKDSFEKAKTPKNIILYKGASDDTMRRAQKQYEEAKKLNSMADMHIALPAVPGTAQGSMGIEVIRGIDTPLIQGSIAFQEFYFQAICYTFGVDPASIGVAQPGRLGNAQTAVMQHGVSQEATQELQTQLAEAWDRFLKQRFPEIKDWKFALESAYEAEESKIWETKLLEMQAAKTAADAGLDIVVDEDGSIKISGQNTAADRMAQQKAMAAMTAASGAAKPSPFGQSKSTFAKDDLSTDPNTQNRNYTGGTMGTSTHASGVSKAETDIEKASRWHSEISSTSKDYKAKLDDVAQFVFGRMMADFDEYLRSGPREPVTSEIRDTVLARSRKVLEMAATQAGPTLEDAAKGLYRAGMSLGLQDIQKQDFNVAFDEEDSAAIQEFYNRTQDAMKNTLYFGDKQTYLTKIHDVTQECINEGGCTTTVLARRLQTALDPEREHFSDYMWERIAVTETAAYVTAGRLKAYEQFDIPKVRRITASDVEDDLCAPFTNAVYKIEDAYGVIPAHPNCRCAFSPYFGPEEPIPI